MGSRTVNVIGVGYIGSIVSLHLAENGCRVVGIDKEESVLEKREWFGRYDELDLVLQEEHLQRIETSTAYENLEGGVSVVCVDTPFSEDSVDLSNVKSALRDLAHNIGPGHTIILRSTLSPGKTKSDLIPLLEEESGLEYDEDFDFCYAPEFVRGGEGLEDLKNPSKTVLAGNKGGIEAFKQLFPTSENIFKVDIETAEAVKCFDNVFHALKITLANESGRLGKELGFNSSKLMEIISSDQKLNISKNYLEPGHSFGGPCLYKDIEILKSQIDDTELETPVISSINQSNAEHDYWLVDKIEQRDPELVGLIGATYKKNFNSLANSPCLRVASQLEERGVSVKIYEPALEIGDFEQAEMSELMNANLWVIFNSLDSMESHKSEFDGDIIDLSDFEF